MIKRKIIFLASLGIVSLTMFGTTLATNFTVNDNASPFGLSIKVEPPQEEDIGIYLELSNSWTNVSEFHAKVNCSNYQSMSKDTSTTDKQVYYYVGKSSVNLSIVNLYFKQDSAYWHPWLDGTDEWDVTNNNIRGTFEPGKDYTITISYKKEYEDHTQKFFTYNIVERV